MTAATLARTRSPALQRLRSRLFDVILVLWTAAFAPAALVLALLGAPERAVRRTARAWARGTLRLLGWCVGLTYVEEGLENIPAEPCLIVANHQSTWETLAFLALFPDIAIVAKRELLTIPVFAWFLRNAPMILIDRDSGTKAMRKMVDESRAALAGGRSVLIFPEGTRRSVSAKIEFKRGIEILYAKLDAKVLTVALKGTSEDIRNRFFQNMSKRAVDMIREEIELLGAVRLREVEKAQQEVVGIARKLEEEGLLQTGAAAGEPYVT